MSNTIIYPGINLDKLDINYTSWKPYKHFNINENTNNIQNYLKNNKMDLCKELKLSTRLGSESVVGIVMKYAPRDNKNILFALKIMPYLSDTEVSIRTEIAINMYSSNSNSNSFAKFFGYGICAKTLFLDEKKPIKSIYLTLELLSFDLRQLLTTMLPQININENILANIIIKIFSIIEDLNYNFHIIHPDLHTKNCMFRCLSLHHIEPVLIDFGGCITTKEILTQYDFDKTSKYNMPILKGKSIEYINKLIQEIPGYNVFLLTLFAEFNNKENMIKYPTLLNTIYYTKEAVLNKVFDNSRDYRHFFTKIYYNENLEGKYLK
jgi:hypothetical protein